MQSVSSIFNPLPNDTFSDWSKLKELANDKINMIEKLKFVLDWVEKNVGKGENAGYQHFVLSYNVFKRLLSKVCEKSGLCGKS